jgi:hypothetical protein
MLALLGLEVGEFVLCRSQKFGQDFALRGIRLAPQGTLEPFDVAFEDEAPHPPLPFPRPTDGYSEIRSATRIERVLQAVLSATPM